VVLYGFVTWSLTLREEHRLRVFENRVLRGIFGAKSDDVTGGCRKLHNEELHNLYPSTSMITMIQSRRMTWTVHVTRMREKGNVHWIFAGKTGGKITYGRTKFLVSEWIILRWIAEKYNLVVWTEFILLKTRISDRLLLTRQ
jgi:hypothetical protein